MRKADSITGRTGVSIPTAGRGRPGVVRHSLNPPYDKDFRYFLDEEPSAWLEGDRVVATLSHGLGMSIAAFIAVIVAHPQVTAKDATAWPKPLRS